MSTEKTAAVKAITLHNRRPAHATVVLGASKPGRGHEYGMDGTTIAGKGQQSVAILPEHAPEALKRRDEFAKLSIEVVEAAA